MRIYAAFPLYERLWRRNATATLKLWIREKCIEHLIKKTDYLRIPSFQELTELKFLVLTILVPGIPTAIRFQCMPTSTIIKTLIGKRRMQQTRD